MCPIRELILRRVNRAEIILFIGFVTDGYWIWNLR